MEGAAFAASYSLARHTTRSKKVARPKGFEALTQPSESKPPSAQPSAPQFRMAGFLGNFLGASFVRSAKYLVFWSEWQDLRLSLSDIEIFEVFGPSF